MSGEYDLEDSKPHKECVLISHDTYFAHLEGSEPSNLYQLLIGEVEPPLLQKVLEYTNGNQSRTATILGISRGTLRKKLAQYNLLD